MSAGFYGNQTETFFLDGCGGLWLVGVFGQEETATDPIEHLPHDARPIHNSIVEESLWQRVVCDVRIAWSQRAVCLGKHGRDNARELCAEAASRFWDLVGEDSRA
jgi:hypothetical protein